MSQIGKMCIYTRMCARKAGRACVRGTQGNVLHALHRGMCCMHSCRQTYTHPTLCRYVESIISTFYPFTVQVSFHIIACNYMPLFLLPREEINEKVEPEHVVSIMCTCTWEILGP